MKTIVRYLPLAFAALVLALLADILVPQCDPQAQFYLQNTLADCREAP